MPFHSKSALGLVKLSFLAETILDPSTTTSVKRSHLYQTEIKYTEQTFDIDCISEEPKPKQCELVGSHGGLIAFLPYVQKTGETSEVSRNRDEKSCGQSTTRKPMQSKWKINPSNTTLQQCYQQTNEQVWSRKYRLPKLVRRTLQ